MVERPQDSSIIVQIVYTVDVVVLQEERLGEIINIVDHIISNILRRANSLRATCRIELLCV